MALGPRGEAALEHILDGLEDVLRDQGFMVAGVAFVSHLDADYSCIEGIVEDRGEPVSRYLASRMVAETQAIEFVHEGMDRKSSTCIEMERFPDKQTFLD